MSTIVLRSVKMAGLTNNEIDANFTNLNTDKVEAAQTVALTNKTIALGSNTVSGTTAQFNTALTDGDFATLAGTETLTNKTLTNPSYSGATANGGTVTTIDINGGTIDGTVIGGSSAAAGSFTTLSANSGAGSGPAFTSLSGEIVSDSTSANASARNFAVGQLTSFGTYDIKISATRGGSSLSGNTIAGFSSTGLAVTGALSATGNVDTANGFGYRWGTGAVQLYSNGTYLRARTNSVDRLELTDTGLAVTGALSATSLALGTAPQTGNTGEIGFPNAAALRWRNGANSAYLNAMYVDPSNNQILGGSAVNNIQLSVTGAGTVGTVSSTGLSVAGAVSATGKYQINGNGSVPTTTALEIGTNGAGSRWLYNVPTGGEHNLNVNGSTIAYVSGVGVGVTGALSATGDVTVGAVGSSKSIVGINTDGSVSYGGGTTNALGANIFCFAQSHATVPNQIQFRNSGNTTRMTLDASGNLGLGVTPTNLYTSGKAIDITSGHKIYGSGTTASYLQNATLDSGGNPLYQNSATAGNYKITGNVHSWLTAPSGTAGTAISFTQAMTLDASGNLGLGVTPSAWSSGTAIEMGNRHAWSKYGYIVNGYFDGSTYRYRDSATAGLYSISGNTHSWYTAPSGTAGNAITFTQAMTLDASGNLGLGVTPSAWRTTERGLEVAGSGGSTGALTNTFNETRLYNNAYVNTTPAFIYKTTGGASMYRQDAAGIHSWSSAASGTAGTTFTFTQSLAVGLGTTLALQGATSVTGCGISFPATQVASSDANTLDDYREGSYTATATGMTTSPTGTVEFVRNGNIVVMHIPEVTGTSNTTAFTLTGGPTTMRPTANRFCFVRVVDNGAYSVGMVAISTAGTITFYKDSSAGVFTATGTKGSMAFDISYII